MILVHIVRLRYEKREREKWVLAPLQISGNGKLGWCCLDDSCKRAPASPHLLLCVGGHPLVIYVVLIRILPLHNKLDT